MGKVYTAIANIIASRIYRPNVSISPTSGDIFRHRHPSSDMRFILMFPRRCPAVYTVHAVIAPVTNSSSRMNVCLFLFRYPKHESCNVPTSSIRAPTDCIGPPLHIHVGFVGLQALLKVVPIRSSEWLMAPDLLEIELAIKTIKKKEASFSKVRHLYTLVCFSSTGIHIHTVYHLGFLY